MRGCVSEAEADRRRELHGKPRRVLGLIGPNGAGKSTALSATLGLTSYQGERPVLGCDPWTQRDQAIASLS